MALAFLPYTMNAQDEDLTPEQQVEIAKNYLYGENGYEKDIELGALYLFSAVEGGNAEAQYILGLICMANEDPDSEDIQNGFELIKKSAEQEFPDAMMILAKCYETGFGVDKDLSKAAYWLEKAKKAGADVEAFNQAASSEDEREYYSVQTTQTANLREGPSKNTKLLKSMPKGTWLVIDKKDIENGYYSAFSTEDGLTGYVYNKYVKFIEKLKFDEEGSLQVVGTIGTPYAEVTIKNDTNVKTTIKIGMNSYVFKPHETKTLNLDSGTYNIIASSPGIKPYVGKDVIKGGNAYEWRFYIF